MNKIKDHQKMIVWQNIDKLDILIQTILKKIPHFEYGTKSQIDNASDSVGSNFVEGFYSGSVGEYIRFCKYSRRSIGELQERVRRILRKDYINNDEYEKFNELSIKTKYLLDRLIYSLEIFKKNHKK